MDDAGGMCCCQCIRNLNGNVQRDEQTHPRRLHLLAQRLTINVFGDDEVRLVRPADFVNGEDVRVVERRGRTCFLREAAHTFSILCKLGWQQLDRHLATQARVLRQINFTHAARADGSDNFVMPETYARLELVGGGFHDPCNFGNGGRFHKTHRTVERGQQRFDFGDQRLIAVAGIVNKLLAFFGRAAQRIVKNRSHFLPIFIHHSVWSPSLLAARKAARSSGAC